MPEQNLLVSETTYQRLRSRFNGFKDRTTLLRATQDEGIRLGSQSVSLEDHPVSMIWMDMEWFAEGLGSQYLERIFAQGSLNWVQTVAAGLDYPLFRELLQRGIQLCKSDAQSPAIAEFVLAAVLYRFQNLSARVANQAAHRWQPLPFQQIYGTNWLIIGFGNIGSRIARGVRAMEGRVTGVRRKAGVHADADALVAFDTLRDELPRADVVVLACGLSDSTRKLVDSDFLARMKPGATLVNIARGELIDEAALLSWLDAAKEGFAILDVFTSEPLPADSAFWEHPRVLVTPHDSYHGSATPTRNDELFFANLEAYLAGKPLKNEVTLSFFESGSHPSA